MNVELVELPTGAVLITDENEARKAVAQMRACPRLGFDTEGDGLFRYRTRLCVVQFAWGDQVVLVDTLAADVLPWFEGLLGADGPEKIVHDASFDARVLFAHGVKLGRVFDTAVAARFLGLKSTGLASLLASYFQLDLAKDKQQADWGARPFDEGAFRYLAEDVRHLEMLADVLLAQVRAQDIEPEVREECAYVLSEAHKKPAEIPPWTRLKGALARPALERARLSELFAERERLARELDVPAGRLFPNEVLSRLAEIEDVEASQLTRLLGTKNAIHSARLQEALTRARALRDAPEEDIRSQLGPTLSPAEVERRKQRKRALTDFRAKEAQQRGVDPQVVLPGHCLNDLVGLSKSELDREGLNQVAGLGACRIARYGERIVAEITASDRH